MRPRAGAPWGSAWSGRWRSKRCGWSSFRAARRSARPFIAERRLFLEQFYRFALDGSGTWTGWLAEHPA
ncbi:hypothetical protein [Sorangium sp. So ce1097]|uniref:hypothetical protein n=1 Tax=Sorangium sp. So ce1097 TaxID=3133330 RepID=UPI003F5F84A0